MNLKSVRVLHDAITAPATGRAVHDPEFRQSARGVLVEISGDATFSVQPEISLDGAAWHSAGAAITETGLSEVDVNAPFFRVNATAVAGGNLTVRIS